jgi:4-oxalocrotonate tautomerase
MPCLEIYLPKIKSQVKADLAEKLTTIFAECTNHPAEIFAIFFHEYEKESVAMGGKLFSGQGTPFLHFLLYCPRLRRQVKTQLVKEWTDAFIECTAQKDWQPVIHLCEHPFDNVGVGGQILSDAFEECAKRKFYYELPND